MDPIDVAMLAQVGKPWLAVVVAVRGEEGVPFVLKEFVGSAKLLARAQEEGVPVGEQDVCDRRGGAPGSAAVGAGARVPGGGDGGSCARAAEGRRAPGGVTMGAGARLPVGEDEKFDL